MAEEQHGGDVALGDGADDAVVLPLRFGAGERVLLRVDQNEREIPSGKLRQLLVRVEDISGKVERVGHAAPRPRSP
ncbi:hypothetical protein ABE83_00215 [Streptomyces sp. CFMR 7]|nr:hypothetical protein ABE83_00215 [Streptomyces sp. CFMR 7]